jgi:glycoprotein 2-beta-D-xylosyltransferase
MASAPLLPNVEDALTSSQLREDKHGKVSQVALRRYNMILRAVTVCVVLTVAFAAYRSGAFERRPLLPPPVRERPRLGPAPVAPVEAVPAPVAPPPPPPPPPPPARAAPAPPAPVSWAPANPSSCDGFFGNGYGGRFPLGEGLTCFHHPALGGVFCDGAGLMLQPGLVTVSQGGEKVDDVMGRSEEAEVPSYAPGALLVLPGGLPAAGGGGGGAATAGEPLPGYAPLQALLAPDPYKERLLSAARVLPAAASASAPVCGARVEQPVLLITRMEYANLFHTTTDWYNAWSVARVLGLEPVAGAELAAMVAFAAGGGLTPSTLVTPFPEAPKLPLHVVFLDGHNAGPMDEGWLGLFPSVSYVKHFGEAPLCLSRAVLAPFGYQAALGVGFTARVGQCHAQPHVRQFGDDMVRGLGLAPARVSSCGADVTAALFVRRVHYLAHPRHNGKVVRRLDNEDEIWGALKAQAEGGGAGVELLNGLFSSLSMRQQVALAQRACVIVGAHGAGLSHVLFAPPEVHVLELQTPGFNRPHFIGYAGWAGSHHHVWALDTSAPSVHTVVSRVFETAAHAGIEGRENDHHDGGGSGGVDHPGCVPPRFPHAGHGAPRLFFHPRPPPHSPNLPQAQSVGPRVKKKPLLLSLCSLCPETFLFSHQGLLLVHARVTQHAQAVDADADRVTALQKLTPRVAHARGRAREDHRARQ